MRNGSVTPGNKQLDVSGATRIYEAESGLGFAQGVLADIDCDRIQPLLKRTAPTNVSKWVEHCQQLERGPTRDALEEAIQCVRCLDERVGLFESEFRSTLMNWQKSTEESYQMETILRQTFAKSYDEKTVVERRMAQLMKRSQKQERLRQRRHATFQKHILALVSAADGNKPQEDESIDHQVSEPTSPMAVSIKGQLKSFAAKKQQTLAAIKSSSAPFEETIMELLKVVEKSVETGPPIEAMSGKRSFAFPSGTTGNESSVVFPHRESLRETENLSVACAREERSPYQYNGERSTFLRNPSLASTPLNCVVKGRPAVSPASSLFAMVQGQSCSDSSGLRSIDSPVVYEDGVNTSLMSTSAERIRSFQERGIRAATILTSSLSGSMFQRLPTGSSSGSIFRKRH